jgi:hypothetical protein
MYLYMYMYIYMYISIHMYLLIYMYMCHNRDLSTMKLFRQAKDIALMDKGQTLAQLKFGVMVRK